MELPQVMAFLFRRKFVEAERQSGTGVDGLQAALRTFDMNSHVAKNFIAQMDRCLDVGAWIGPKRTYSRSFHFDNERGNIRQRE